MSQATLTIGPSSNAMVAVATPVPLPIPGEPRRRFPAGAGSAVDCTPPFVDAEFDV
jgi:hypothetical protein